MSLLFRVCLYFSTGTECTKVVYTSSSSGSSGHPRESYSTVTIVRSIINTDSPRCGRKAPFQFYTPDQLPSSMYYKDGNGSYVCVSYQLKLQIGREVVKVIPIRVIAKPSLDPLGMIMSEDRVRRRIMFAGCLNQSRQY